MHFKTVKTNIMKKIILSLIVIIFTSNLSFAQWWGQKKIRGNGDYTTQTRNVDSYDEIALTGSLDVYLVAGSEGNLRIQAESNLMDYILTEVQGDKLKISVEKGYELIESRRMEIKIEVPVEDSHGVSLTGSGDIQGKTLISAEDFKLELTGSGDIELHLEATRIRGSITGSGDVDLRGKTEELDSKVTGSGDFDASKLVAERVMATVSGSGDIEVNATQALKARVQGSGDITYKGNPEKQDFKTAGSGAISKD